MKPLQMIIYLPPFSHPPPPVFIDCPTPHLVLRIHLGHHAVLEQVEVENLQHVQLMCHLIINGRVAPDHILHGVEDKWEK